MLRHAGSDDFSVLRVERSKQSSSAVAFVIMSHGAGPPFLQRQARLGAAYRFPSVPTVQPHALKPK